MRWTWPTVRVDSPPRHSGRIGISDDAVYFDDAPMSPTFYHPFGLAKLIGSYVKVELFPGANAVHEVQLSVPSRALVPVHPERDSGAYRLGNSVADICNGEVDAHGFAECELSYPYQPDAQFRTMCREVLLARDLFLEFDNVCLPAGQHQLSFREVRGLFHPVGGIASRLSGDASGPISTDQESDLESRYQRQQPSESLQPKGCSRPAVHPASVDQRWFGRARRPDFLRDDMAAQQTRAQQ